mmetsp:Transcript_89082/g.167837  ORF Transcript_89082/g.167837 Transcript_89082/m.167837 type:complete len:101 (-) Transcript_89082:104-406(-)
MMESPWDQIPVQQDPIPVQLVTASAYKAMQVLEPCDQTALQHVLFPAWHQSSGPESSGEAHALAAVQSQQLSVQNWLFSWRRRRGQEKRSAKSLWDNHPS